MHVVLEKILNEIRRHVVGRESLLKLMLVAILSGGHILIEGPTGIGKTTIAKIFAKVIGGTFRRIQMTPDTLPSDIIGTYYFNIRESKWELRKGPIFANVVLVDELNRAPPRTQAAFLEAMQELQVTKLMRWKYIYFLVKSLALRARCFVFFFQAEDGIRD